ncbi:UNVERIFIED_CONTAM: hypothetical protein PYX00_010345 [Menopon gallinae]|uniref:O-acyltransferase n=1 Tax=Menopon gallinae TaxID=328185 RepID=A0AAW2HEU1_9NEOP
MDVESAQNGEKGSQFQEKNFQIRESLLSALFQVPHIRTIYHIFTAFLINLVINTALHDYVKDGKITVGFRMIYWSFKDLPLGLIIWLGMQLVTLLVYSCFATWGTMRAKLFSSPFLRVWDWSFIILLITFVVFMLTIPTYVIIRMNFSVALSFSLLMEQVRFVMKTHSFVRTCAPRVLSWNKNNKGGNPNEAIPSFKKFAYFLFAPTLLYRDEYPRSPQRRWKYVAFHFTEVLGVICFLAFLYENYMLPAIQDFGKTPKTLEDIILVFFTINTPAILYFMLGFFSLLHSWMNAFAEMLRFGDRMFYQDWWNSGSFPEYYKKWNVIVHDWLYAFIYRDATEKLTKNKVTSTWLVFLVSAIFHEFILAFTFRFCYPVLFIVFGICSTCLYFVPSKYFKSAGNFILWLMLIVGVGFCASLYFLEFFARVNCPRTISSPIVDFFIPRSWSCGLLL